MIQDRNGSLLHSLLMPFRKTRRHDESEPNDSSAQESRQRLEQRIELALANVIDSAADLPPAAPIPSSYFNPGPPLIEAETKLSF
jgi:hypothetical protein